MNGVPLEHLQPSILRYKLFEPVLLLGKDKYKNIDIRIRVRGGGQVSQLYAIRQAVAKSIVAYYQKCTLPFDILTKSCLTCADT